MKLRAPLLILLIIILVWLQLAVEGNIGFLHGRVNLVLAALVILVNLTPWPLAVIVSISAGLLLDVYSGLPFGVLTAVLFVVAVIVEILFINFFTNFSLYSLVSLGLIAAISYNILFLVVVCLLYFLGYFDFLPFGDYSWKVLWQVFSTIAIMLLTYFVINRSSRQFKPMFLK